MMKIPGQSGGLATHVGGVIRSPVFRLDKNLSGRDIRSMAPGYRGMSYLFIQP